MKWPSGDLHGSLRWVGLRLSTGIPGNVSQTPELLKIAANL